MVGQHGSVLFVLDWNDGGLRRDHGCNRSTSYSSLRTTLAAYITGTTIIINIRVFADSPGAIHVLWRRR